MCIPALLNFRRLSYVDGDEGGSPKLLFAAFTNTSSALLSTSVAGLMAAGTVVRREDVAAMTLASAGERDLLGLPQKTPGEASGSLCNKAGQFQLRTLIQGTYYMRLAANRLLCRAPFTQPNSHEGT